VRFFITFAYDGSKYSGYQKQPKKKTIQGEIEKALKQINDGKDVSLVASGRTDAGVHALGFVASFLAPERPDIPPEKLLKAVNRQLPGDIKVMSIKEVPFEFHSRYDAMGKAYTYVLNLKDSSPFTDRYSWRPLRRLDPELLNAAAQRLVGTHDFSSFVVERSKIDDAVRTIYRIDQQLFGDYCTLTFVGNGFLYKMIRCLMGTIEAAGAGKLSPDAVTRILESKDRTNAPETAPPQGLFLMKVFYDKESLDNFKLEHLPFH
jgi:tRNA pseudouridine38-40 synthase